MADLTGKSTPAPPQDPTWAVLLAKWVDFARAAVALRNDGAGHRWRRSVAPVITLQAVTHALSELWDLPPEERALGLDRSELLIQTNSRDLDIAWKGEPMPERLLELIADARVTLEAARASGWVWTVCVPRFIMPDLGEAIARLLDQGFPGDLLCAPPGTLLFSGSPALCAGTLADDLSLDLPTELRRADERTTPLQVYRQCDADGQPLRDVVAPLLTSLPPGQPLLIPVIQSGTLLTQPDDSHRARTLVAQRDAIGDRALPVVPLEESTLAPD